MKKKFAGAMVILAVLTFMVGLIICMCDTPSLEQQIRNMGIGSVIIILSVFLGLAGERLGTH